MQSEGWPAITCERFMWETPDAYKRRSARIAEIMTGFRMGRFARDVADRMEDELVSLQEIGLDETERRFMVSRASASNSAGERLRQSA